MRGLVLTAPQDDPRQVEALLNGGNFIGIKPYHLYAPMADTRQAAIETFAPEWMWDLCNAHDGILMLHIMRDRAISDEANLTALARLTSRYPRCRLILAHVGRSFGLSAGPGAGGTGRPGQRLGRHLGHHRTGDLPPGHRNPQDGSDSVPGRIFPSATCAAGSWLPGDSSPGSMSRRSRPWPKPTIPAR